ncbi:fimbrial protein [Enterobacter asburiae]|uniref:fimbrial protein n=1 Tax=Scandinavium sp. UTDF21-P1B TaxID=3446379 RepID=UPI00348EA3CE
MNLNKTLLAVTIALSMTSAAQAADAGHGKVTFTGSIIDAACSIAPEAVDQTVELGQISKTALQNGGKSTPRNFSIALENCSFAGEDANNKVQVTFTGMESAAGDGLLGITGSASGASVAITSGDGQVIKLGQPTQAQQLNDGTGTLSFSAYVQGHTSSAAITEGEFQSIADFTLAYN